MATEGNAMYWTPLGSRVLRGAEARLFREGLGMLFDMVRDEIDVPYETGVGPFAELGRGRRLFLLHRVGSALLRETEPEPKLTAALEAAVAAIFDHIRCAVEMEIQPTDAPDDGLDPTWWRRLVLDACLEDGEMEDLPAVDCLDPSEWDGVLQGLASNVLWDEDFLSGDLFLDLDPERSDALKEWQGIDRDYYVDVPPEPDAEEIERIERELVELTRD